jgi:hypothetical protein
LPACRLVDDLRAASAMRTSRRDDLTAHQSLAGPGRAGVAPRSLCADLLGDSRFVARYQPLSGMTDNSSPPLTRARAFPVAVGRASRTHPAAGNVCAGCRGPRIPTRLCNLSPALGMFRRRSAFPPAKRAPSRLRLRVTSVAMPSQPLRRGSCGRSRPRLLGPATNILARLPALFGPGLRAEARVSEPTEQRRRHV